MNHIPPPPERRILTDQQFIARDEFADYRRRHPAQINRQAIKFQTSEPQPAIAEPEPRRAA